MQELNERIVIAANLAGLSQSDIAKAMGIGRITVHKWFHQSRSIESERLYKLSKILGVSLSWLAAGVGDMQLDTGPLVENDMVATVKRVLRSIDGRLEWQESESKLLFKKDWIEKSGRNVAFLTELTHHASDDMSPTIPRLSTLIVDISDIHPKHGAVYVIDYFGDILIRRVSKLPNSNIRLSADNSNKSLFPDVEVTSQLLPTLRILGSVLSVTYFL